MTATTEDPATVQGEQRMLIGGALVDSGSGRKFDNINPATEEVLGQVADADVADMDLAIAAARKAFDESSWATDRAFRQRCLRQLQDAIVGEQELLRAELVAEVGCPVAITYGPQLDAPLADGLLWPAQTIDDFEWERELPVGEAFGMRSWRKVLKEPAGVVGAIIPWNYPFEVTLQKLGQALATGNTLIVKPAPDTPWNATRIGRLIAEQTDIPAGVVNVVTTSDNAVAEQLVVDPRVDLISFTGSTAVGRHIMAIGAPTMKRFFLELGGKSAQIVLDDADLASAVGGAAFVCVHAGQGCAMMTRLLVPRSRYDESIEILEAGFAGITYGDPTDAANLQGPQISAKQRERVLGYIDKGVAEGARLVLGGGRPAHLPKGWYVEPTLFADVTNDMTIAREEIFGPVQVVIPFDDDADAVRIANDNVYGLSGMVFSGSEERAISVAKQIRSGTIGVNGGVFYGADAPFGGYKASGYGRQNGLEGFEQYLETKTLSGPAPRRSVTDGLDRLRVELRSWLDANLTPDVVEAGGHPVGESNLGVLRAWNLRLADAGWAAPSWPVEHGGRGAGVAEQVVYLEEMNRARAPGPVNVIGVSNIAPAIMHFGTEEQKARFLGPMLSGREIWSQGMSEPDAGSDLAALRTAAVEDGDEFVINGQKTWNSMGHFADWCQLYVRTDPTAPKHKGITCFLVDLRTAGIEARPVKTIAGDHSFAELFLADVRVPRAAMLGQLDQGWTVAMTTLSFERAGVARLHLMLSNKLADLLADPGARAALSDRHLRARVARVHSQIACMRWLTERGLTDPAAFGGAGGSLSKLSWSSIDQSLGDLAVDLLGMDGLSDRWAHNLLSVRQSSIAGGTTEINRNIVAEHVLGLPR